MNKKYRYNHLKNGYSDFLFQMLYKYRGWLTKGPVLDVGCGHGRNLALLKTLGFDDLIGIDILERTGEVPDYIKFISHDIEKGIPAKDGSSRITLFNYVYMFLKEDAQAYVVKELLRVTKGLLIIETYTPKHDPKYFYPFDIRDIKNIIDMDESFEIIEFREKTGKLVANNICMIKDNFNERE